MGKRGRGVGEAGGECSGMGLGAFGVFGESGRRVSPRRAVWFVRRHITRSHYRTRSFGCNGETLYFQIDKCGDRRTDGAARGPGRAGATGNAAASAPPPAASFKSPYRKRLGAGCASSPRLSCAEVFTIKATEETAKWFCPLIFVTHVSREESALDRQASQMPTSGAFRRPYLPVRAPLGRLIRCIFQGG